jgi:peptidyl-prolyl cis-trans isomerase SurA
MKRISLFLFTIFAATSIYAQDKINQTLVTINGVAVSADEFIKVYEKNLDLVQDPEQKKIENYLPLFISYKSKLMQAYKLGLDTVSAYKKELAGYRKDLAAPYFKDPEEEQKLLKEAWQRSKYDLNVSHILLMIKEDASAADTLKKYNEIISIRKEIESGKISFTDAAKKYSEGPSNVKGGKLGWMTVFQMVYPFESGAYNTPVGEISQPIRSSYGYHLIKVNDKRDSKGKVQIAHIYLRAVPGAKKDSVYQANKVLMDTIYSQLKSGKDFASLARRYSDDKRSGMNGGVLPVLKAGKMMPEMEKLAFSLDEGEVSKPFSSQYGWHILKVLRKYPISSFEDSKEDLSKELSKDNRSKYIKKSVVNHLFSTLKIKENKKFFTKIEKSIDTNYLKPNWKFTDKEPKGTILTIEDRNLSANDYIKFLEKNPVNPRNKFKLKYVLEQKRKDFIESELLRYYDDNLENKFPEFKDVMTNYREGILIYNLMNKKIWDKSYSDSTGLANYYEDHKTEYMWPERADVLVAKCFNEKSANKTLKYMKRGKSKEYIEKKINKNAQVGVTFQIGIITQKNEVLPENFKWTLGVSKIYKESNTNYIIVKVNRFVNPQIKTLEECKNKVRTDYQNFLEKQWDNELKNNYKVKINEAVLKSIKEKYNQ